MARPRPGADDRGAEDTLLRELASIYAEVDARFAGWTCDASTTCCRFGLTGREPYVTGVELLAVRRAVARSGRKLELPEEPMGKRRGRRDLAQVDAGGANGADERRCPLLGKEGLGTDGPGKGARCTIYASRPFGCRTFFCDRAVPAGPVAQRDINAFVGRIRTLAVRLGPGADEGRPLVRALRDR